MVACESDVNIGDLQEQPIPEGWTKVTFTADTPLMTEVAVRAADPDGIDVQNLTLFCFNDFGLYITHTDATNLNPALETPSLSGTYEAIIPEDTRIIHFVANQSESLYNDSEFVNRAEHEIMDNMVGSTGMIVYWSRFIFREKDNFQGQLAEANNGEGIKLIRNQAKVTVENGKTNGFIDITGFIVTNIHAFGTVAPYHPENGFPTNGTSFTWPGDDYVTMPQNLTKLSDITGVTTKPEEYIFEHENTLQDPVSIILRGKPAGSNTDLYYRVLILDDDGEQIMIRRNHHYKLNIVGSLAYGQETFEEALTAPATNNVWVAVDDWVNEISYGGITLSVSETSVVLGEDKAGSALTLNYTIKSESDMTNADAAEISWLPNNTVAAHSIRHSFSASGRTGEGTIDVQLLEMGASPTLEGTLVVKKGRLQRTIKIMLIKKQKFTPVWAATQIYGGSVGELATLKFTIPEDFPFFPFNVYISANNLDVRTATTGRALPIVRKGEEGYYGDDNGLDYKYVYTVTEPGTQRLYMHTILQHEEGGEDQITLEAEHFETVNKIFHYTNHKRVISVDGLNSIIPEGVTDEPIYYRLVPRKINAPVQLEVSLRDISTNPAQAINAGDKDEFFIYTRTLDSLQSQKDRDMFNLPDGWQWDCDFFRIDDSYWQQSTNGRMIMFKPTIIDKTGDDKGKYTIYLKTNAARSDDMVRIASNQPESHSALPNQGDQPYEGNTYRSFIFELATYHPFRFAAQIAANDEQPIGTWNTSAATIAQADEVDYLEWSYLPKQKVDINFEITSFEGADGKSVDPFGTEFEVYIDAPMLEIDNSRLSSAMASKLKPHATIPGRFVYTVDQSRETERAYGNGEAVKIADKYSATQSGERKTLPFKTSTITSAGEIVISSNKDVVEFFDKRFKVTNRLIEGRIQYYDGANNVDIPVDAFVGFATAKNGVRIGSMSIVANGRYALNLRAEYDFDWLDDQIKIDYIKDGVVYEAIIESMDKLYRMAQNNEVIRLIE
ncbi:MAG: hypothetical protein IIU85_02130 [Rikenellaceae bacterium]|nr:hypothetical protein [Rikenellaceae bacterium]